MPWMVLLPCGPRSGRRHRHGAGRRRASLALVGDGDLVGDGVGAAGFQHAEQTGEAGGHELDLVAGALADLVPHIHPRSPAACPADEGEREIFAGHADLDGFLGDGLAGRLASRMAALEISLMVDFMGFLSLVLYF